MRLLVLLGASEWPNIPGLHPTPSFLRSKEAVGRYFFDVNADAVMQENVLDLFNSQDSPSELDLKISDFLEGRIKTSNADDCIHIMVYYVGHGEFGHGDALDYLLLLRGTRKGSEAISSYRVKDLAAMLGRLTAPIIHTHVILDACFAASAFIHFQSFARRSLEALTNSQPHGTALFCASSSQDVAIAPKNAEYTLFTEALLAVWNGFTPKELPLKTCLSLRDVESRVRSYLSKTHSHDNLPELHAPGQLNGSPLDVELYHVRALSDHNRTELVLFDRYHEKNEPFYSIRDADNVMEELLKFWGVWIHGPSGIGKTALSYRTLARGGRRVLSICLACYDGSSDALMAGLLEELVDVSGVTCRLGGSIEKRIATVLAELSSERSDVIVYVDEIPIAASNPQSAGFASRIVQILARVRSIANTPHAKLVLSSLFSPQVEEHQVGTAYELLRYYEVPRWTRVELLKLAKLIDKALECDFSTIELEKLVEYSIDSPRKLKQIFRMLMSAQNRCGRDVERLIELDRATGDWRRS